VTARDGIFGDLLPGIRVGIDMDGVLADFNTGWMSRYNDDFGTELDASLVQEWDGLHQLTHFGSMAEFWAWAQGEGRSTFRDAPPLPGAIEAIKRIGARHRVAIVSSKFEWAIPDSLAWLADHGVPAREVHFLWDKTLAGCDIYLDDAPHHLQELRAGLPKAVVCRMVQPWNAPLPGVIDVHSWEAFEAVVERVAAERQTLERQAPQQQSAGSAASERERSET
jgi:5'(3')-deoxyribonucleotidase